MERHKIMQAANYVKATVLDGPLALMLLQDPYWAVRTQTYNAVSADRPALSVEEVEAWVISGDGSSRRSAINYIRSHPKPEYRGIVLKVLQGGWLLSDPMLFEAIIKTNAVDATDTLRAYLEREHIDLRTNAAITLVHLGDESGAEVLPDLLAKAKGSGQLLKSEYIDAALKIIGGTPVRDHDGR
jgi:hypothetical protein